MRTELLEAFAGLRCRDDLTNFVQFCLDHPELRLWQALSGWSAFNDILAIKEGAPIYYQSYFRHSPYMIDTFHLEKTPRRKHDDSNSQAGTEAQENEHPVHSG